MTALTHMCVPLPLFCAAKSCKMICQIVRHECRILLSPYFQTPVGIKGVPGIAETSVTLHSFPICAVCLQQILFLTQGISTDCTTVFIGQFSKTAIFCHLSGGTNAPLSSRPYSSCPAAHLSGTLSRCVSSAALSARTCHWATRTKAFARIAAHASCR